MACVDEVPRVKIFDVLFPKRHSLNRETFMLKTSAYCMVIGMKIPGHCMINPDDLEIALMASHFV